jgi:enoyl-CoA hydratase
VQSAYLERIMIETEDRGEVRVVALNRPPVNALNLAVAEGMNRAIRTARNDTGCKALVLTGTPGIFSAGIDTREVPRYEAPTRSTMLRAINQTICELYAMPKPVVAAVSGHALGGALVLVLACDLRLAAKGDFRLGLTESAAGIPFPAGPLIVVQAELSPENARALALTSPTFGPQSLVRRGVIDRVVEPPSLLEEAVQEARRLAAMPAFARVKEQLRARTCDQLRRVVERDEEPLHRKWI